MVTNIYSTWIIPGTNHMGCFWFFAWVMVGLGGWCLYVCGREKKLELLENCESSEDLIQNFSAPVLLILTGQPLSVWDIPQVFSEYILNIFPANSLLSGSW